MHCAWRAEKQIKHVYKEDSAMKKKINLLFGFTIAELLISLLITAIVAAAMVPVIGLKKLKSPHNRYGHGIAECYYEKGSNGNWQLMYYYADNNRRGSTQPIPVNGVDYCTFTPPKADYFEIIAIGAGTDGVADAPVFDEGTLSESELEGGKIRIDGNFQTDIKNAHITNAQGRYIPVTDKLRNLLNDWHNSNRQNELKVGYNFQSPIGAGGSATCQLIRGDSNDCNSCISPFAAGQNQKCRNVIDKVKASILGVDVTNYGSLHSKLGNPACFGFIHASGGDSAPGYRTNSPIEFLLSGNSKITSRANDNEASIKINTGDNEPYFKLTGVAAGDDGGFVDDTSDNPKIPGIKYTSPDSILNTSIEGIQYTILDTIGANSGTRYGIEQRDSCRVNRDSPATPGKIFYPIMQDDGDMNMYNDDAGVLVWKYSGMLASPKSGYGGNPGNEKTVVYENLKKPIILRPAPYIPRDTSDPDVENNELSYVSEVPNNEATTLVSASSGGKHGKYGTMPFTLVNADMPIPRDPLRWAKPDNREHFTYVDKINASQFSGGIKSLSSDWPGFAGTGTYFYIDELPNSNTLSVTNRYNNKTYYMPTEKVIQEYAIDLSNPRCDDKITQPTAMNPVHYQDAGNIANPEDEQYSQKSFTPKYCRESKVNGSPGAIIIMW